MRRTQRDVHELFNAYCRAWEHSSVGRAKRLESHGWVRGVWVREYDGVVRMAPTDTGKEIIAEYWAVRCDGGDVFERYDGVPELMKAATTETLE